jgi:hypothetical protein
LFYFVIILIVYYDRIEESCFFWYLISYKWAWSRARPVTSENWNNNFICRKWRKDEEWKKINKTKMKHLIIYTVGCLWEERSIVAH